VLEVHTLAAPLTSRKISQVGKVTTDECGLAELQCEYDPMARGLSQLDIIFEMSTKKPCLPLVMFFMPTTMIRLLVGPLGSWNTVTLDFLQQMGPGNGNWIKDPDNQLELLNGAKKTLAQFQLVMSMASELLPALSLVRMDVLMSSIQTDFF
jgi:hypothetical protein